jgi:excisionase family DNA binding protein
MKLDEHRRHAISHLCRNVQRDQKKPNGEREEVGKPSVERVCGAEGHVVRLATSSEGPLNNSDLFGVRSASGSLKTREWLTTEQAADYLGLSKGALRNMTSNGQVPYHKLGRRNRYSVVELRQLLLSQKRGRCHGN